LLTRLVGMGDRAITCGMAVQFQPTEINGELMPTFGPV
jgi:hypothetical protein